MNNRVIAFIHTSILIVLEALIIFTPLYNYKKMVFILAAFLLWLLFACFIDIHYLRRVAKFYFFLILFVFLDYVRGTITGIESDLLLGINKMPTFIWAPILLFYIKPSKSRNAILFVSFLLVLVGSYYTISGNILHPGASRLLAGTDLALMQERAMLRDLNIGGYDFIYALVFWAYPIVLAIKYNNENRIILSSILVVFIATVVLGAYMIGIIIMFALILIALMNPNKLSIWSIALIALGVFLFKEIILDFLGALGDKYDISALSRHSLELMSGTYGEDMEQNRIMLYLNGLTNWLQHPLLGDLSGRVVDLKRSGHSEMIGFFEKYGLLALFYVWFFWDYFKAVKKTFISSTTERYFLFFGIVVLVFLFVDRFDTFNGIGLSIFFLCPLYLLIIDEKQSVSNKYKS